MTPTTSASSVLIPSRKIYYLDAIKLLLTGLVVLHHTLIAYGAPGGWYFRNPTDNPLAKLVLTMIVATDQSFFMGMFFMLSSYFVGPSYDRKGAKVFVIDRLKRLGIPFLIYSFLLATVINYLVYRYGENNLITFWQFLSGYDGWINPGVMWFASALLLFTLVYVAVRQVSLLRFTVNPPTTRMVVFFALTLGLISFLVRLWFPIGWTLDKFGYQVAHFPQYIALFMVGILAQQNHWLDRLSAAQGRFFGRLSLVMILLILPLLLFVGTRLGLPTGSVLGGWNVLAFSYSMWEQLTGISIIVALLSVGKQSWNRTSPALTRGSRYAFGVYVLHPLVVVSLTLLFLNLPLSPVVKLLLAAPLAVGGSVLVAALILRIPGANRIF